jgi:basic amino acid/polyamine antiporter, APA family
MPEPSPPVDESSLLRAIGVLGLAAGIVNVTVGGGIFRLPADVARGLGPAAPFAYLVCAVAMGLIVLCFAEAGSRVDLTGGPYAYVETAFGPFLGFQAGVLLWVLGTMAVAAVSVVFATNATALFPWLRGPIASGLFLVVVFLALSAVNIAGVRRGTALNTVATVAKLLPLLFLIGAAPFFVDTANLTWTQSPSPQAVSRTSVLLIFAFCGVESALLPSGEVKDSARTVPRAIFVAMAGITVLYMALQLTAQGMLGSALGSSPTPLADAAGRMFGPPGRTLLLLGATVSMFGYVSGMILAVPRALFAFARDGFLPARVASVHERFHTPHVAIAVQSIIVCAFALTSTFERLVVLANLAVLVLYALCCLAAWQLRRRNVRTGGVAFQVPAAAPAPFVALLVIAWMLTGVHQDEWTALAATLAAATFVFLLTARSRRARQCPTMPLPLEEAR